jgi:mono/diheme cytochrome c family protein
MRAFIYVLIGIALFLVPVLAIGVGRGWTSDKPPIHWNPNMDTQEKGKAFRADQSGVFTDDHRYMRTPPEGTVARGYLHDDDQLTRGVDAAGAPLQKLPDSFLVDTNTVPRGKNRYMIYCAPCHGKDLDGKGAVFLHKGLAVPPPAFNDSRLISMPVGQMYKAIHEGVNNNNMPSYAVQIPENDRWAIVAFLCTYQTGNNDAAKACTAEFKKPFTAGSPGEALWASKGCNACHTLDGTPKVGPTWKGLGGKQEQTDKGTVTVDAAYIEESIRTPAAKIVNGFPPAMPQLALTDGEIKTLVDFILNDPKLK